MNESVVRDRVRSAIEGRLFETAKSWVDHERTCRPLVEQMAEEGLFALQLGVDGGEAQGYSSTLCVIREMFGYYDPLLDITFALQGLGTGAIVALASEEVRGRYLPDLVSGRKLFAFALSEAHCASDVLGMRTTARRDGDGWVIDGQKMFVSGAPDADVYVVFARTDGLERGAGITAFVVEKGTPGFEPRGGLELSAPHAMGYVDLNGCRLSDDQRIGDVGGGLRAALGTLETYRPSVGAFAVGMGLRALDLAIEFGRDRQSFGAPLLSHPVIRVMIGRMAARMAAGQALVREAAAEADAGTPSPLLASAAKLYGTEMATAAIYDSQQIHGGRGVLAGQEIEALARNVRGTTIYEGTSEIQHRIIGRFERARVTRGDAAVPAQDVDPVLAWTRVTYERWLRTLAIDEAALGRDTVVHRVAQVCLRLVAAEALAAETSSKAPDLHALAVTAVADEAAAALMEAMLTGAASEWDIVGAVAGWASAATGRQGRDEVLTQLAELRLERGTGY